ncbi:MAG: transposase [Acidobacteriaceae bacterium]
MQPPTYAVTISTFLQQAHFQREAHADLFLATLLRYRHQNKFRFHGFAIMPNHVHLVLTPQESIAKSIQLIKGGYSFAARTLTRKEIWHSGYHEHRIRDIADYNNQLLYIANNPPADRLPADYPYVHTHPKHSNSLDPCPFN